jgi:hypothetical protein
MDRDERNGLAILAVIAILFVLVAVALSSQLRYEAPEASMLVPLELDWGQVGDRRSGGQIHPSLCHAAAQGRGELREGRRKPCHSRRGH